MKLTPTMKRFVLHWGEMGTRWGVNRSVAQIHALLYLSPEPQAADAIVETLGIARSNVSSGLKELQSWGLIQRVHVMGDRRDHFTAIADTWEMLALIAEGRKRREIDPTLIMLRECVAELAGDRDTDPTIAKRIGDMLNFVDTLSTWYDQMRRLPRRSLVSLIKLGARIEKLLSRVS
jgi:DNA-binding transcriptional regulator GbsR (MarR family)